MNRVTDSLTKRGILAPIVLVDEHRNVTKNATLTSGGKRLIHAGKAKNKMNRQSTTTATTTTAAVKRAFKNETFLLNSAEQVIELNSSLGEDMSGRNRRQLCKCYKISLFTSQVIMKNIYSLNDYLTHDLVFFSFGLI
jgi:hypothetical protein